MIPQSFHPVIKPVPDELLLTLPAKQAADLVRLHPGEVMREALRRSANGNWVKTGPPVRVRKYKRRPSQKRERPGNDERRDAMGEKNL